MKIRKAVRQGDTLSPVMFTAEIEETFKRLNIKTGINGKKLNNIRFADDIILFDESGKNLNVLIDNLNEDGKKNE